MSSRSAKRKRKSLGPMTAEALLAHRELELLRQAYGRQNMQRRRKVSIRFAKLVEAKRRTA